MNIDLQSTPRWATAADGDAADTRPMELMLLGDHLLLCRDAGGNLLGLRSAAEQVHGFVSQRFVTTLVAATAVMAGAALLF